MARYRPSWKEVAMAPLRAFWRPHLMAALLFEVRPSLATIQDDTPSSMI